MSGVNSKMSLSDLSPPSPKRLKPEDSKLARIESTEQMEPQTALESPDDRVLIIPDELWSEIIGNFAADYTLGELIDLRIVCELWKREVFSALKANRTLLPLIVGNLDSDHLKLVNDSLSTTESGNRKALKSVGSCLDNVTPGRGFPIHLVVNRWTPELDSFLRSKFSSDIVNFWICGDAFEFEGFPEHLRGIELPSLENARFSAHSIRNDYEYREEFVKALAFWKELVKVSKNRKTCELNIRVSTNYDDEVFDLLEWNRVNSLQCSYEFYQEATASKEFSALQKLKFWKRLRDFEGQLSLEQVAHLEELEFGSSIEWRLDHPMKNLKMLTLRDTTITCGQSPSNFLPSLKKIVVDDEIYFRVRDTSTVSSLIMHGGEYENVVHLSFTDGWDTWRRQDRDDFAVRLCDSFPKLTELEWESKGPREYLYNDNRNAFKAAPVIFSRLESLTRLKLTAGYSREKIVVELISGIPYAEVPQEEASWLTLLDGNPRSISNLKHLQSFSLNLGTSNGFATTVSMRHTRFLFMAAFRKMTNLKELYFKNITFEDTSSLVEWQQMGRKIEIKFKKDIYIIPSFDYVSDTESSGPE